LAGSLRLSAAGDLSRYTFGLISSSANE
jgi:hypothetical protein